MLVVLVPLFDENMAVSAYSIFTQKDNYLLNPAMLGTGRNDGAFNVEGLQLIQEIGIDTLSDGKEVFVPITNISVFSDYFHAVFVIPPLNPFFCDPCRAPGADPLSLCLEASRMIGLFSGYRHS